MASGLQQAEGFDLAVVMTRWMFPYIAFMSLVALGAGVLNTWKRFWVAAATPVLPLWQERLFLVLARFAVSAADFFGLPANRTVELGSRIEI